MDTLGRALHENVDGGRGCRAMQCRPPPAPTTSRPWTQSLPPPLPPVLGAGTRITTAGSLVGAVSPATFSNTWGLADSPGSGLSAASLRRLHSKRAGTAWWLGGGSVSREWA